MTHPDSQGKGQHSFRTHTYTHRLTEDDDPISGYMSKIMREGFANAPGEIFGLESTTAKSQAQYAHLGYEVSQRREHVLDLFPRPLQALPLFPLASVVFLRGEG